MNSQNEIARIAYELYLMRGGAPGDPVADWLTAERIFAEQQKSVMIRTLEEPVLANEEVSVMVVPEPVLEKPVAKEKKTRKAAAPKAEAKVTTPKAETRKPATTKTVTAPKAEKVADAPKPRRVSRKKATTE